MRYVRFFQDHWIALLFVSVYPICQFLFNHFVWGPNGTTAMIISDAIGASISSIAIFTLIGCDLETEAKKEARQQC